MRDTNDMIGYSITRDDYVSPGCYSPSTRCGRLSVSLYRLSREPRHMIEDSMRLADHNIPPLTLHSAPVRLSRIPSCASGLRRHVWRIPLLWSDAGQVAGFCAIQECKLIYNDSKQYIGNTDSSIYPLGCSGDPMLPTFIRSRTEFQSAVQLGSKPESLSIGVQSQDRRLERTCGKSPKEAQKETCRDIAQFANTLGGCLLVGVSAAARSDPRSQCR